MKLCEIIDNNILLFSINDEITFWSRQMTEHILFLFMAITDEKIKIEGIELYNEWKTLLLLLLKPNDILLIKTILIKTRKYKIKILKLVNKKWIGYNFPSSIEHMISELDYFRKKLDNIKFSLLDEFNFWTDVNGDHAEIISQNLDISEYHKINKLKHIYIKIDTAKSYITKLKNIKILDSVVKQYIADIMKHKVNSIMPLKLIKHISREEKRSIDTLTRYINIE